MRRPRLFGRRLAPSTTTLRAAKNRCIERASERCSLERITSRDVAVASIGNSKRIRPCANPWLIW